MSAPAVAAWLILRRIAAEVEAEAATNPNPAPPQKPKKKKAPLSPLVILSFVQMALAIVFVLVGALATLPVFFVLSGLAAVFSVTLAVLSLRESK